jgi:hypothetical protein
MQCARGGKSLSHEDQSSSLGSTRENGSSRPLLSAEEPVFVNLLKEPGNRFPAWQAGTTTLF